MIKTSKSSELAQDPFPSFSTDCHLFFLLHPRSSQAALFSLLLPTLWHMGLWSILNCFQTSVCCSPSTPPPPVPPRPKHNNKPFLLLFNCHFCPLTLQWNCLRRVHVNARILQWTLTSVSLELILISCNGDKSSWGNFQIINVLPVSAASMNCLIFAFVFTETN